MLQTVTLFLGCLCVYHEINVFIVDGIPLYVAFRSTKGNGD